MSFFRLTLFVIIRLGSLKKMSFMGDEVERAENRNYYSIFISRWSVIETIAMLIQEM